MVAKVSADRCSSTAAEADVQRVCSLVGLWLAGPHLPLGGEDRGVLPNCGGGLLRPANGLNVRSDLVKMVTNQMLFYFT